MCPFYRKRPTSLSLVVRVSSSRSASVSCCPHSQSKKVRAERQTDSGPPSTTFSPHSSQRRTTCLPEPTTSTPSASLFLRGRHPLITNWSPQGEPASTMRDLCFTRYCLNPQLRFRLARGSGSASRAGASRLTFDDQTFGAVLMLLDRDLPLSLFMILHPNTRERLPSPHSGE
jgi:hypothetical protein